MMKQVIEEDEWQEDEEEEDSAMLGGQEGSPRLFKKVVPERKTRL